MFVSIQMYWLQTNAGLHSHHSLRKINNNNLVKRIGTLGKLTELTYLCVRMDQPNAPAPLHIASLYETHIWIFWSPCKHIDWLRTYAGLYSHYSLRSIDNNQFIGSIEALDKLTKLTDLCVGMG